MRLTGVALLPAIALLVGGALVVPARADPLPPPFPAAHLTPPYLAGTNGPFKPVGTRVRGVPATYLARYRAGSATVSLLWIDTTLARAVYSPGYQDPGGPNSGGGLAQRYWPDVVANVNGAFKLKHTKGGYYYDGTTVQPLVNGRASAVTYRDGSLAIGEWGRDVRMTADVTSVRQNVNLLVDRFRSQVKDSNDHSVWGPTTHRGPRESRSAIGERPDGSLVYAMGANLRAVDLADALVAAGVARAMVLDMNGYWPAGFYFAHKGKGAPACAKVDSSIAEGCTRLLGRYKKDSYQFLARSTPMGSR